MSEQRLPPPGPENLVCRTPGCCGDRRCEFIRIGIVIVGLLLVGAPIIV